MDNGQTLLGEELPFGLCSLVTTHIGFMIWSLLMCFLDLSFLPSQMVAEEFNLQILNVLC